VKMNVSNKPMLCWVSETLKIHLKLVQGLWCVFLCSSCVQSVLVVMHRVTLGDKRAVQLYIVLGWSSRSCVLGGSFALMRS
jgi:hypothetical protein